MSYFKQQTEDICRSSRLIAFADVADTPDIDVPPVTVNHAG